MLWGYTPTLDTSTRQQLETSSHMTGFCFRSCLFSNTRDVRICDRDLLCNWEQREPQASRIQSDRLELRADEHGNSQLLRLCQEVQSVISHLQHMVQNLCGCARTEWPHKIDHIHLVKVLVDRWFSRNFWLLHLPREDSALSVHVMQ